MIDFLALLGAIAAIIIIAYLLRDFLDKPCKFSYISKFHIIISCKLIVYIVMCFYQETN